MEKNSALSLVYEKYSVAEIEDICKSLNRQYNIYDTEDYRWDQIAYLLAKTPESDLHVLRELMTSNQFVNESIMNFYPCERVVKYYLIKHLMPLCNHIVAFEMCIGNSRIDVCRVNGHSYAYEIKTEYDTFDRLETQMQDYIDTFEKVYIVVPKEKADEVSAYIPPSCGILAYRKRKDELVFSYRRKAILNECNMPKVINSLSSADLQVLLRSIDTVSIPFTKQQRIELALQIKPSVFWNAYKELLKSRYASKWNFVVSHFDKILPIDIQNFFTTTIDPSLTYVQKGTGTE